ncbi:hypothetical protein [Pseudomonas sp. KNUC1026]|uniref:hypothetical protein n=1 Tax=Pseudomonas sp. KNUC1026 TaxID=2893890 RepID=UPI001F1B5C7C|nr:hypothetical protein [Pseudomonas sp. KNUC1026]UFH51162.1 hypothetical protein LN139_09060 [Pseudomonas sp. KNUC1026]
MNWPTTTVFAFIPQQIGASDVPQSSEKLDSQVVSIFQTVGISYSILDRMTAHDAGCANAAADFFVTTLMKDGWSWNTSNRLVTETDWQHRMYRAWSVLNAENRGIAAALDYEVYQNYWPNLEFCADGFQGKIERWIAGA